MNTIAMIVKIDPATAEVDTLTDEARDAALFPYTGSKATREGAALVDTAGLGWGDATWCYQVATRLLGQGRDDDHAMWLTAAHMCDLMPRRAV